MVGVEEDLLPIRNCPRKGVEGRRRREGGDYVVQLEEGGREEERERVGRGGKQDEFPSSPPLTRTGRRRWREPCLHHEAKKTFFLFSPVKK